MRDILLYIGSAAFLLGGCAKDSIVFPEQVEVEEETAEERGPVKQTQFKVITDNDEKVVFMLLDIDQERVQSIFFSHNPNGEEEDTEVTSFEEPYVIENLPVNTLTSVDVWAKGLDGLLSKKHAYQVLPREFPSRVMLGNVSFAEYGLKSGKISFNNTTSTAIKLHYKLESQTEYAVLDVEALDGIVHDFDVPLGFHQVEYYLTDDKGGESEIVTTTILSYQQLDTDGWEVSVSTIEINEGELNGQGFSIIDGDINTYWHSRWWPDEPNYPHWIVVDMLEEKAIVGLDMIGRHNNTAGGFQTFNLQYSEDGEEWSNIAEGLAFDSRNIPQVWNEYEFPVVVTRYLRIFITEPNGSGASTHLAEIKVYGASTD